MKVYNLIIVDESGSMSVMHREAVTGLNETIQTVKASQEKYKDEQKNFVTIVFFDTTATRTICDRVLAEDVKEIAMEDYRPCAGTPLYDAIGFSVNNLRKYVEKGDKVIVTIITDGYENASREFSGAAIAKLIEELKKEDWLFTYIGANQDVEQVSKSMNIDNFLAFEQTAKGSSAMFRKFRTSRDRWAAKMGKMKAEDCCNFFYDDPGNYEDDEKEKK